MEMEVSQTRRNDDPKVVTRIGRPRKARRKAPDEVKKKDTSKKASTGPVTASRKGTPITCSRYLEEGQNIKTCKNSVHPDSKLAKATSVEPSQNQLIAASQPPILNNQPSQPVRILQRQPTQPDPVLMHNMSTMAIKKLPPPNIKSSQQGHRSEHPMGERLVQSQPNATGAANKRKGREYKSFRRGLEEAKASTSQHAVVESSTIKKKNKKRPTEEQALENVKNRKRPWIP